MCLSMQYVQTLRVSNLRNENPKINADVKYKTLTNLIKYTLPCCSCLKAVLKWRSLYTKYMKTIVCIFYRRVYYTLIIF